MKENKLKRIVITGMLLGAALLFGQPASRILSLEQARELALANNSAYQARQAELESARWSKASALGNFLPTLTLDGSLLYMDPEPTYMAGNTVVSLNNDYRTLSLSLSQPVFLGGKLWQGYQMAKISEEMAKTGLAAQRLSLLAEVNSLYLSLLQATDLQQMSELDLSSARRNMEIAQLKHDNGLLSNADYLRFQSRLATKDVARLQANTARQLAQLNLRNYLALDYLPEVELLPESGDDAILKLLQDYDADRTAGLSSVALSAGLANSSSLKLVESGVELSRRAWQISKGKFLPTLMLIGSRRYEENGTDRYKFEASSQIMLTASLPLLPQLGNYASLRKAEFDYKKARLEARNASNGILLGTEAAVLNLVSSAQQVKASRLALDYTRQSYEQLQERFRMNLISSTELLDAELMLSSARLAYTNAHYAYLKNRLALMQSIGLENEQELDTLITSGVYK